MALQLLTFVQLQRQLISFWFILSSRRGKKYFFQLLTESIKEVSWLIAKVDAEKSF